MLLAGKPQEALATFGRSRLDPYRLWGEAVARHTTGETAASDAALGALVARHGHTAALRIAEAYAWRGERDRAVEWLGRAAAAPGGFEPVPANPFLRNLRDDARYVALLRGMNLPIQ